MGYLRHKKHTLKEKAFAVFFLSLPHTLLQKHMLLKEVFRMSQRTASYSGRRVAPTRRRAPAPRKAPPRPTPSRTTAPRPEKKATPAARRRMAQMVISAALLLAVVAMKFLFPAALERCRATLLELLGADTDFVEVFSAAGRAFSSGSDALTDAYTAVFGAAEVPASGSSVPRTDDLPGNVDMLQRVLNFDYTDPVPAGDITSLFGARSDPLEGGGRFHYGLDIAGEEGAVISAFADGVVTAVGDSTDLGKYVTVTHEGGYSTLYAHCRRITASDGQQVRCGDPIAEMGDTGRATGVHLHFELHQDDVYLNPIYYVTFA